MTGVTASGLVSDGLLLSMRMLSVTAELTIDSTVGDRDTVGSGELSAVSEGAAVLVGLAEDCPANREVSVGTILVSVVVTVTVNGVTVTVVVEVVVLEVGVDAPVIVRVDRVVNKEGTVEETVLVTGRTTDL